jgi:hypothetical protein
MLLQSYIEEDACRKPAPTGCVSGTQMSLLEIPYQNQSVARNCDFLKKAC